MITLFQPPPAWDLPSLSPFCVKLEAYLRMTKIPFKTARPNLAVAPKGKIPYIQDGEGPLIGDSGLVIDYLVGKYGDRLDQGLSAEELARGHAIRRMLEESTYFGLAWLRWSDQTAFTYLSEYFRKVMPPVLGLIIPRAIRSSMLKTGRRQGIGRHSQAEIVKLVGDDFRALAALLGDRQFILGDKPRSVDASVFSFINGALHVPWDSEIKAQVRAHANLVAYADRMRSRFWSQS